MRCARNQHLLAGFRQAFGALEGNSPFPWQERLFQDFCNTQIPSALDLPTGLGKTSVMAIWFLARTFAEEAARNSIPRRLAYVVDRRAVVDQATAEAEKLRRYLESDPGMKERLGLGQRPLPISTLRGQYVDNREWLEDPAAPAIVVGTVDMIGSRLLFSGYGASARMRPYHAGFLGADTLIVLDEAHLVPPFEALLTTIADDPKGELRPPLEDHGAIVPRLRLMSLSATGRKERGDDATVFRLTDADRNHKVVDARLKADKRLTMEKELDDAKKLADELATRAWKLATDEGPSRILVYCNYRDDALKVKAALESRAKREEIDVKAELLVGERRVRERDKLSSWLETHGFIGSGTMRKPASLAFLVATSAGEVGVDLDADHMICDLVEWERMVQRLGRVNRRGAKQSIVVTIPAPSKDKSEEGWNRLARVRQLLDALKGDGSPAAISALKENKALTDMLQAAQTPPPLRPALTRALVDAWSMTSLEEHTGRPDIQPWLRGWVDEAAQTIIVWRRHLPVRIEGTRPTKEEIGDFIDAAPPQTSEMLEAETWRVVDWLIARAGQAIKRRAGFDASGPLRRKSTVMFALNAKNELEGGPWSLDQLAGLIDKQKKREREAFLQNLSGRTLIVSSLLGGLNGDGMLATDVDSEPSTIDSDDAWEPPPSFRVRETLKPTPTTEEDWRESHRFAVEHTEDREETRWLVVEQRRNQTTSEQGRAIARFEQKLTDHQSATASIARRLTQALHLPPTYAGMLEIAGRLHDEGKQAPRWQRAFNAPTDGVYAKTRGPINQKLLDGYRHEFGSLSHVEKDAEFQKLPSNHQDLVLHIIAAHHGGARPLTSTRSCEAAPPSALEGRAREVALRFARLQRRWGPWGLAWWEALLRAADQQASRENDVRDTENDEGRTSGEG